MNKGEWIQFERRLTNLINMSGLDATCNMPDYILARYLMRQIGNIYALKAEEKKHHGMEIVNADERDAMNTKGV